MNTLEKIKQVIAEELGRDDVTAETSLEELGIDSLEFVSLMQALGRAISDIPETRWEEIKTVGDIERIVIVEDERARSVETTLGKEAARARGGHHS
jgi:acyl carrier protein